MNFQLSDKSDELANILFDALGSCCMKMCQKDMIKSCLIKL